MWSPRSWLAVPQASAYNLNDRRHMLLALGIQVYQGQAPACETVPSSTLKVSDEARKRLQKMFEDNHASVWRLLRRLGLNHERATDMTQQAFLIAAERIDGIKLGSEKAFLYGTALRLARTATRVDRRWVLEADLDQQIQLAPAVDDLVEQRRATEILDRVLCTLPPDLVTVFVLFELEGLSTPEVACIVGVPVGTAASRLRRARELFRAGVAKARATLRRGQT